MTAIEEGPRTPIMAIKDVDDGPAAADSTVHSLWTKSKWLQLQCLNNVVLIAVFWCILYFGGFPVVDEGAAVGSDAVTASDLSSYLRSYAVLQEDPTSPEAMDAAGSGVTVIRDPVEMASPINVDYTPLRNATTGQIEYFAARDADGNAVAKPQCQTDFEASTHSMKGGAYQFDPEGCAYPLPSWMEEADILRLPRRRSAITHFVTLTTPEVAHEFISSENVHHLFSHSLSLSVFGGQLSSCFAEWPFFKMFLVFILYPKLCTFFVCFWIVTALTMTSSLLCTDMS